MAIRQDNSINQILNNIEQYNNRSFIRNFLLNKWIQENSGTKYRYFVEVLANGNRLYLERPGRLNKGCDFVIYIENTHQWKNGNDRPPDHNYILNDLSLKKQSLNQAEWTSLLNSISSIYNCETYNSAIRHISNLPIINGHSYELLLKTIRWLFIEQDITYWSGQGRGMFLSAIQNL
tara:strand:- start:4594 stop:5124 length:531 start_codon:yes stop_codon:yes gene_type:complete